MILREMLRDERAEGKAESVIELLQEIGPIPEQLQERIINEKDMSLLLKWLKLAAKSESIQQFEENMQLSIII